MEPDGKFRFEVVKPDGPVLSEPVDECVVPGVAGYFGVLPGHAPFLTLVGTGEIMYRIQNTRRYLAVNGGFCEVRPEQVTVLAETAERAEDIDLERATRAREKAEARMQKALGTTDAEELQKAKESLERAQVRARVAAKRAGA